MCIFFNTWREKYDFFFFLLITYIQGTLSSSINFINKKIIKPKGYSQSIYLSIQLYSKYNGILAQS